MRVLSLALLFLFVIVFIDDSSAQQKLRKHKKYKPRHHHKLQHIPEEETLPEWKEVGMGMEKLEVPQVPQLLITNNVPISDPCLHKHCGAGRVCHLSDDGEAECLCIPSCPLERDPRRKVCTNHNETWGSDCEVYQMQCYCDEGSDKCTKEEYQHIQIDYYGQCREMPECKEDEMADFPRRMRDWLFNIMRDLADRQELSPHYLKLEREAETNLTRRWSNAAVWKWCDLDGHPHDRSVSRHELFPIRAPLMSLEHCIAPFLDLCDVDDNHRITLTEWAKCLELEEEDLEDRCEVVRGEEEEE
ncbi:SPARC [Macrosteles quadrilineatus]|uniref:SPARC n=1 Tax=Macrosteles quadrilineatus TaxID=74068 RepID=UPI0023E2E924|nr:SPARC [Macrosteles quadrilineatus]